MAAEFGDLQTAAAMRDVIRSIVQSELQRQRPEARVGIVDDINYDTGKARVRLDPNDDAVTVQLGALKPAYISQIVRVDGPPNARVITDVFGTTRIGDDDEHWRFVDTDLTFQNGWVNFDPGQGVYSQATFRRLSGFTVLTGMISGGTIAAPAFTLPVGYRPLRRIVFPTIGSSGLLQIDVTGSGDVVIGTTGGGNSWVTLSGIQFVAEA